ncbi:MAG: hypothetical protein E7388_03210 [Ruminococcaceae bacterium]|nr:hypothetical protein [Oscillospiraceae bacterium]
MKAPSSDNAYIRCKIADLIAEVPCGEGLESICEAYKWNYEGTVDISIDAGLYRIDKYDPRISRETVAYMESAYQFYLNLVDFNGFYLHSSAVVRDGRAYLFSGPCRAGKSTHTRLWKELFGKDVYIINDDKPALRHVDGKWYVYGTPWCGKDGINMNEKALLAGVCFLKKAPENKIRIVDKFEAMQKILGQTIHKFDEINKLDKLLKSLELFLEKIPVYELENVPEVSAAELSYNTMFKGAKEAGL